MHRDISDGALQLDALDGVRGFAALIVILSHTSNSSMFYFPFFDARGVGKSGVFLFFLLSSFLLSRALIKQGDNAFSISTISRYAQRRFFRIYPLYIPYLFFGLASTALFSYLYNVENIGMPFSLTPKEFFGHMFLMEGKGVTWSIAVEFKFYFILPLIIFFSQYIKNKLSCIAELIFLLFLVVLTQVISPQAETAGNDTSLLPYMCIFLFGTILAVIQCEIESGKIRKDRLKSMVPLSYLCLVALLFMTPTGASLLLGDVPNGYFHKYFIQYSVLWGVILLSVINFNSMLSLFFQAKWLCFYGALSFSIYLFHPIFIPLAYKVTHNSYLAAWFVLFSSTATSYISFRLLEKPASRIKISFNKSSKSRAVSSAGS